MKTKKGGVLIALAAVLLLSAVLVTSCQEEVILRQAPEGKGMVILNIGNDFGRTVFPAGNFAAYELTFTPAVGPAITEIVTTANPVIPLPQGTYDLVVDAYTGYTAPDTLTGLAATGTETGIPINIGGNTPVTINLEGFAEGEEEGFLVWNFTFPDIPTTVLIEVFQADGTPAGDFTIAGAATITNTATPLELDSGYYIVKVTMTKADFRSIVLEEAVHIYDFLTSTYTRTFPSMIATNGSATVTISFAPAEAIITVAGPEDFEFDLYTDAGEAVVLVINIDPAPFTTTGIKFFDDEGNEITTGLTGPSNNIFTLAFDVAGFERFLVVGIHTITVIATTAAGVPYSASYTFEVVDTTP